MDKAMVLAGDPLADAVIAELERLGPQGRRALEQGLADGLASLDDPPPAVAALLRDLEREPKGAESEGTGPCDLVGDLVGDPAGDLADGDRATQAIPPPWDVVAFAVSMMHVYASPPIARLLRHTGRLTADAPKRLAETGAWRSHVVLPGGLLRGAPGYIATAHVRLMHARVRVHAQRAGWDSDRWGLPINQADLARTWLAFTIVPFRCLSDVIGIGLSDAEERQLYRYWRHIGRLLGLDDAVTATVHEHADAAKLLDAVDRTTEAPGADSRELTVALFAYASQGLARIPDFGMSVAAWHDVLGATARAALGDQLADALGIEAASGDDFLPAFAHKQAAARRVQIADPDEAEKARQRHIAIRRQRL
ncbi:MAG: oxygenase MpaB family protein [Catenulispora sp.]